MYSASLASQQLSSATLKQEAADVENHTLSVTRRQHRNELAERYRRRKRDKEMQTYIERVTGVVLILQQNHATRMCR